MIILKKIIPRLRMAIKELYPSSKILDKDIANYLNLDPQYFAVIKKRGKIPYESLAIFAHKNNINLNWLLLESAPKYLNSENCRPLDPNAS